MHIVCSTTNSNKSSHYSKQLNYYIMNKKELSCIIKYAQEHNMMSCSVEEVVNAYYDGYIEEMVERLGED